MDGQSNILKYSICMLCCCDDIADVAVEINIADVQEEH